ncbi:hypothetical protein CPC08DRAFT_768379 [Agrocybe pediades]|nr:hypothetical protein CPC08DRAFT_768379 [Agrocybe pediades]
MARSRRKKSKSKRKAASAENLDNSNSHSVKSKGEGLRRSRRLAQGPKGKESEGFGSPKISKRAAKALSRALRKRALQQSFPSEKEEIKSDRGVPEIAAQKSGRILPHASPSAVLRVEGLKTNNAQIDDDDEEEHDELDDEDEDEDEVRRAALHKIKVEWGLAQPIEVPNNLPLVDVEMKDEYGGEDPMDISDDEPGDNHKEDGDTKKDDNVVSTSRVMIVPDIDSLVKGEKWKRRMSPQPQHDQLGCSRKKRKRNIDKLAKKDTKKEINVGSTPRRKSKRNIDKIEKDNKQSRGPSPPQLQPATNGRPVYRDDILVRIAVKQMAEKGITLDLSRLR